MSLTEAERHQIIQWFPEQMGPERGELMMKAIAPVGWSDIATNRDLRELEARLDLRFQALVADLRGDMGALRHELRADLGNGLRLQTYAILGGGSVLVGLGTALAHLLG